MDIGNLWSLQLMMFILMAAGVILVKSGAVKPGDADRSYVVSVSALQYHQFLQDAVCY